MQIAGFDQFMWVSPAEMVVNYFFGSVRYLKSNAKKMCQYKMRDGVAIFSKKLVFSNEGQKEENVEFETHKSEDEVQMRDRELKMWEEDLEDEWERNIRDDEEAMIREMEVFHSWIEEEEYEIDRERFGDG